MSNVILYRRSVNPDQDDEEIEAARAAGFKVLHQRTDVQNDDVVIGRYSVLPFYKELELDLKNRGALLVNTYRQHQFIADMREWCEVLGDLTPRLYPRLQDIPAEGPFVLKGQTNSKKHMWNTHMFAQDKREAGEVWSRLRDDMLLADQEIYVRDYIPLARLTTGIQGLPITKEFRVFVLFGQVFCKGFYWSSHVEDIKEAGIKVPEASEIPEELLLDAIEKIGLNASFYAIDVAQTASGKWIVVEINDGQMSGLSCIPLKEFYEGLWETIV